jgi:hypothetical protein
MELPSFLGFGGSIRKRLSADGTPEYVLVYQPLQRIMEFTGFSIDDIVNNPIAKNTVLGYYRVCRQVDRGIEIGELERQWNP